MNFRESYGLKPKVTFRCPECGMNLVQKKP